MPDQSVPFRRELDDNITVAVDGTILDVDPDIAAEPPPRVIVTMPNSVADGLAHLLGQAVLIADILASDTTVGDGARQLAQALFDAASSSGYRCPVGGPTAPPSLVAVGGTY